jgi:flagellar protein FlaG
MAISAINNGSSVVFTQNSVAKTELVDKAANNSGTFDNPSFRLNEKTLISDSDVKKAITLLNDRLHHMNRGRVMFSIDPSSGRDVVRVTDRDTGDVIRQLPTEEMLKFLSNLDHMIGVIFDQKT